jgi:hypothetical protein
MMVEGRVSPLPCHHPRSVLVPFDVASERSKVGMGEDVGMLGQDVGSIGLEGLLSNCPVGHRKQ